MNWYEKLSEGVTAVFVAGGTAIVGGVVWLVRRTLTNERQIALLRAEQSTREELRARDREDAKEIKNDIRALNEKLDRMVMDRPD